MVCQGPAKLQGIAPAVHVAAALIRERVERVTECEDVLGGGNLLDAMRRASREASCSARSLFGRDAVAAAVAVAFPLGGGAAVGAQVVGDLRVEAQDGQSRLRRFSVDADP